MNKYKFGKFLIKLSNRLSRRKVYIKNRKRLGNPIENSLYRCQENLKNRLDLVLIEVRLGYPFPSSSLRPSLLSFYNHIYEPLNTSCENSFTSYKYFSKFHGLVYNEK